MPEFSSWYLTYENLVFSGRLSPTLIDISKICLVLLGFEGNRSGIEFLSRFVHKLSRFNNCLGMSDRMRRVI